MTVSASPPILFYRATGKKSGSSDHGVLLLHGINSAGSVWEGFLHRFASRGRNVAVDLPGHGRSPSLPHDHDFHHYTDRVAAMLATLEQQGEPARWQVVGHSFGGMIAVDLADRYRHRVSSLILVAPAGIDHPWYHDELSRIPPWLWLRRIAFWLAGTELIGRRLFGGAVYDVNRLTKEEIKFMQATFRQARALLLRTRFYEYPEFLSALSRWTARGGRLGLIWGQQDRVVPLDDARRIMRAAPGATLLTLGECGHLPMIEQPEAFYEALQSLLVEFAEVDEKGGV